MAKQPKTDKQLTPKQQMFVKEYLIDLNATQAAIRAGYSAKRADAIGWENLRKPEIAELIDKKMRKRSEDTGITSNYVLETIRETIERCRQAKPVLDRKGDHIHVETADGEIKPAYTFDSNAVLRGCELLGKHLKLFTDKTELTGADGVPLSINVAFESPQGG